MFAGMAAVATDLVCGLVGRRRVVRAARFTLNRARLDRPNQPAGNGEYALQRWVLATLPTGRTVTVFDVGANVGAWSQAMIRQAGSVGREAELRLHAFEPAARTCDVLRANLDGRATVNQVAVSDRTGTAALHVVGACAGRNSLHPAPGIGGDPAEAVAVETVPCTTVDDYLRQAGIESVDLIKVDAEGHDLAVLAGARATLRAHAVSVVQFEYNIRWVFARAFLRDAFELLQPLGYQIGKLTPRGVEFYPAWDPDLESFVEGNYVAGAGPVLAGLPRVTWWKPVADGRAAPSKAG